MTCDHKWYFSASGHGSGYGLPEVSSVIYYKCSKCKAHEEEWTNYRLQYRDGVLGMLTTVTRGDSISKSWEPRRLLNQLHELAATHH